MGDALFALQDHYRAIDAVVMDNESSFRGRHGNQYLQNALHHSPRENR